MNETNPSNSFIDSYRILLSALEKKELDSTRPCEVEELTRLILQVTELAKSDAEKTQLHNLVGRIEKIDSDSSFPDSEECRKVLRIWKSYLTESIDISNRLNSASENEIEQLFPKFLESYSEQGAKDVIRSIAFLFQNIPESSERTMILRIIVDVPPERRVDFIEKASSLLEITANRAVISRGFIFSMIQGVSVEQRADFIEMTASVLQGIKNSHEQTEILHKILWISPDRRVFVIRKALRFFEYLTEGVNRATVLSVIKAIPPEEIDDVIEKALPVFDEGMNGSQRTELLRGIGYISADQRADVIQKSLSLFEAGMDGDQKTDIIRIIGHIPAEERSDVIERTLPFSKGIPIREKFSILQAVAEIPVKKRAYVIEKALPVLEDIENGYQKASILEVIGELPFEDKADFTEWALPLLQGIEDGYQRANILRAIRDIPSDLRSDVIEKAMPLFQNITNGVLRACILRAITKIPTEHRTPSTLESIAALLQGITNATRRANVLKRIDDVTPYRRAEAVRFAGACKSLVKENVLRAWNHIPPENGSRWETFFLQLDKIHDPELQRQMIAVFRAAVKDVLTIKLFESQKFNELFANEHSQVFRLFAAFLWQEREDDESLDITAAVLNSKPFKDVGRKKVVLGAFKALLTNNELSSTERIDIVKVVFRKDEIEAVPALQKRLKSIQKPSNDSKVVRLTDLTDKINRSLLLIEAICHLGHGKELKTIEKSEELEPLLETVLKNALGKEKIENFSDRCLQTFGSFRDSTSLYVYIGKIQDLPETEKTEALKALGLYVKEVLKGEFPISRYEESSSEHMVKVFENREELKRRWQEGKKLRFEELLPAEEVPVAAQAFNPKEYLRQRIVTDNHISQEKIPYLAAYLNTSRADSAGLVEEIRTLEREIEADPENRRLQQNLGLLKLQEGLLFLLRESNEKIHEIFESKVAPFIETALPQEEQFKADLLGLGRLSAPQSKKHSFAGWTAVDTDDPQDLLLCGTEVEGSCQNIRGTSNSNKCLLAYLLDGKNRLIAVKDAKGRIVARSILRILWDETKQTPVLFRERVYSSPHADSSTTEALDRMCLLRAQELQLSLVAQASSDSTGSLYPNALKSLGSRAPFEYTDAGGGQTRGTFTVRGVLVADFSGSKETIG